MTDRACLKRAHEILQRGVFEAWPEDFEDVMREAYEVIDSYLHGEGVEVRVHPLEVEALVEDDADRSNAA